MTEAQEFIVRAALIGIGATAVMDLWNAIQKHFLGVPGPSYAMVGRWLGHFPRRRFVHDSIAKAAPVRGELAIGWAAHYAIGIIFAGLLLAVWGLAWARRPTLLPALIVGLATLAAPFLIMQPGMGAGIAASKTPNPSMARLRSLANHATFGIGLYVSALLSAWLIREI
jgi:hypothetical protein